jgi:hypothetical protein
MMVPSAAPSLAPASQLPSPCFAYVWQPVRPRRAARRAPRADQPAPGEQRSWLAACYWLTPRVERIDAERALLDLGVCTLAEAQEVALGLLRHLDTLDTASAGDTRIGLGPSPLLAQCALIAADQATRIATLTPDTAPPVLRAFPVRLLPRLHPTGTITTEAVERLEHFGLRTLGQIARLDEPTLRRQFGNRLGAILHAISAGQDIRPLIPTAPPRMRRFRLPFVPPAPRERARAALPMLAQRIARHLADEQLQAGTLRLLLVWESGATSSAQSRLRAPIAEASPLARHLEQLADTLAQADAAPSADDTPGIAQPHDVSRIARIVVEVSDLSPVASRQEVFWETAARKHAALAELAGTLARRYPRPPLLRAVRVRPYAIFRAERYELRPLHLPDEGHIPASGDVAAIPKELAASPWDNVPHRMHWW